MSRSVDPAREAAEARVQRFLDAGFELINSPTGDDLTVQNVVERSGLSLRSFYHHFGGKHELLLALLEESVRLTADRISAAMDATDDPLERLRILVTEYYRTCQLGQARRPDDQRLPPKAFAHFTHQLLADHHQEAADVFAPLVSLTRAALDDAAAAGAIRTDRDHQQVSGLLLQTIMFHTFAPRIAGSPASEDPAESGELLWTHLLHGLAGRS